MDGSKGGMNEWVKFWRQSQQRQWLREQVGAQQPRQKLSVWRERQIDRDRWLDGLVEDHQCCCYCRWRGRGCYYIVKSSSVCIDWLIDWWEKRKMERKGRWMSGWMRCRKFRLARRQLMQRQGCWSKWWLNNFFQSSSVLCLLALLFVCLLDGWMDWCAIFSFPSCLVSAFFTSAFPLLLHLYQRMLCLVFLGWCKTIHHCFSRFLTISCPSPQTFSLLSHFLCGMSLSFFSVPALLLPLCQRMLSLLVSSCKTIHHCVPLFSLGWWRPSQTSNKPRYVVRNGRQERWREEKETRRKQNGLSPISRVSVDNPSLDPSSLFGSWSSSQTSSKPMDGKGQEWKGHEQEGKTEQKETEWQDNPSLRP